jgi:hypothetical protein
VSVPEVRRLALAAVADGPERGFHLGWSRRRRAHQATAQRCRRTRRSREKTKPAARCAVLSVPSAALTDAQWERIRRLLPPQRPPTGRPHHDHRTVLGGILWVLRTASPWREMPPRFGKWDTAYARYRLWRRQGLWQQIVDALGPEVSPPSAAVAATGGEVSL